MTFSRASLDGVSREWWSYRSGCLVVTYADSVGVERIVSAAPISDAPQEDRQAGTVTLAGRGPSWLLEDRVVLPAEPHGDIRRGVVALRGLSFRGLVSEVVRLALAKANGGLPVVLPGPVRGRRERTYEAWNVSNNGAWKRIVEMTEVIGGPDVQFRPRWANDERTRFEWVLLVGTDAQQTLPQDRTVVWDATAARGDVAAMAVTTNADDVTHRVYATGAGEGAGVALQHRTARELPRWMPLVERVISDADVEDTASGRALLASKAAAAVRLDAMDQIDLTVNADPVGAPIGTWWCGELVRVVADGWLSVPDGDHDLRVIATRYELGSDLVQVQCQPDMLGEELSWSADGI
ncbi:hypothetical protein [Brachybacterium sp. UMB0905]|uniref:hypothetical protein n=1 Tax=Brachybacterium sp. UMB0905 TaxID=2069310 RepID=UPI001E32B565|nr:hypothetical protein [Brachybacterium sp. UMB0905]